MSQVFFIGDVLSLVTGRQLNLSGERGVREIIEYITSNDLDDCIPETLWTHAAAETLRQYPQIAHCHDLGAWLLRLDAAIATTQDDATAWLILFNWLDDLKDHLNLDLFLEIQPIAQEAEIEEHEKLLVLG